jgi:hypothetical protein
MGHVDTTSQTPSIGPAIAGYRTVVPVGGATTAQTRSSLLHALERLTLSARSDGAQ